MCLRMRARAIKSVDLNAGGGTLSCASQLVSVRVLIRAGWVAANTCAIAPPVSLATRSTLCRSSSAQSNRPVSIVPSAEISPWKTFRESDAPVKPRLLKPGPGFEAVT